MTCIADANVLFPLLVDRHVAYEAARRWWEKRSDDSVGLCLLTRMAVLRLLTNRVAMNGAPTTPELALNAWQALAADPRSVFVDVAPSSHENFLPQWLRAGNRRRIFGRMRGLRHWRDHSIMNS